MGVYIGDTRKLTVPLSSRPKIRARDLIVVRGVLSSFASMRDLDFSSVPGAQPFQMRMFLLITVALPGLPYIRLWMDLRVGSEEMILFRRKHTSSISPKVVPDP